MEAFRALIRMGANPNVARGDDNATPLMLSCEFSLVMVRELLEAGADPAMVDSSGKTGPSTTRDVAGTGANRSAC